MDIQLSTMIRANKRAIRALELCIHRMEDLIDVARPSERKRLGAEIEDAVRQKRLLQGINIHLEAATVEVADMAPAVVEELENLETSLNEAIVNDAIASAGLDFISGIVSSAIKIGGITMAHS